MRDTTRLDWRVPADAFDRFVRHVEDEYGKKKGYLGREVEAAMKEHIDLDGYNDLEEKLDRLVQAAGRTLGDQENQKNSARTYGTDRSRVTARVETRVKEEFATFADRNENPYGYELARALDSYLDGGRRNRMEDKLDRVIDDAESVLSELDTSTDDGLDAVQRRTISIATELGEQFTDDDLVSAIREAGFDSEPTIRKYRERVTNHKNVKPHPGNPALYIPAERADELKPDGVPDVLITPAERLSRHEKRERLEVAAGAQAYRNNGKIRVSASEIESSVFQGDVSRATVNNVMKDSAGQDGFGVGTHNNELSLTVNLNQIAQTRETLFRRVKNYYEADIRCLLSGQGDSTFEQYISSSSSVEENDQPAMTDGGHE